MIVAGICILHALSVAAAGVRSSNDPESVASRAIEQAMRQPINGTRFWAWSYGPGIQLDAMERVQDAFPNLNYSSFVSRVLDLYSSPNVPNNLAYQVLHNETVPWSYAIGDQIGLFPIAYLDRALNTHESPVSDDLYVATKVASQYVFDWPKTLPDGTFSRTQCWEGQTSGNSSGTCLWADDQFMGLTLMLRLARNGVVEGAVARSYLERAIDIHQNFAFYLQDRGQYPGASPPGSGPQGSGLYFHGANLAGEGTPSCCFWGRAQGWGLMSHVEVLSAIDDLDPGNKRREHVQGTMRRHLSALAPLQGPDGRWHQLVNDSSTYLETSVSAMAVHALSQGLRRGWVQENSFGGVLERAWGGLAGAVLANGTVEGICCGTGIQASPGDYKGRSTAYDECQPGLGSVFYAAISYGQYRRAREERA